MHFRRSQSFKHIDEEWHETRNNARHFTFGLSDWGEEDIVKYDLETAGITGRLNARSYKFERPLDHFGSNGINLEDLDDR
jgi:hypothetical protein